MKNLTLDQVEELELIKSVIVYSQLGELLDGLGDAEGLERELILNELKSRGVDAD